MRTLTLESLKVQFHPVFDLSPVAMRHITPAMKRVSIGREDVGEKDGDTGYASLSHNQTVWLYDRSEILKFTREQISWRIVSCGVSVEERDVQPNADHLTRIQHPSMGCRLLQIELCLLEWIGSVQAAKGVPAQ